MSSNLPKTSLKTMKVSKNKYKKCKYMTIRQETARGSKNVRMTQILKNNKFKNSPVKLFQIKKTSLPKPKVLNDLDFHMPALPTYGVIGRDEDVKVIRDGLEKHQKVAICGMAGMGKTTLAIYCANIWQKQAKEHRERGKLKKQEEKDEPRPGTSKQDSENDIKSIKQTTNEDHTNTNKKEEINSKIETMSLTDLEVYEPSKKKLKIEEKEVQPSTSFAKPQSGEEMSNKHTILPKVDETIEKQNETGSNPKEEIDFLNIAFLLVDNRKNFENAIKSLAKKLYINEKQKILEILKDIEKLYESSKLLLILDNLEKLNDIEELLQICEKSRTFYILCTSQNIELDVRFCCFHLDLLDLKAGVYLMLKITNFATLAKEEKQRNEEAMARSNKDQTKEIDKITNDASADENVENKATQDDQSQKPASFDLEFFVKLKDIYFLVGGLPLSLAHAASWIEENFKRKLRTGLLERTTHSYVLIAEDYLGEFKTFLNKDFPEQFKTGTSKSAFLALKLNIDKLTSSDSKNFLYQLSFLNPENIDLGIFEPIVEDDPLETALEELSKFSLISITRVCIWEEDKTIIRMHRLTQEVARNYLEEFKSNLAPLLLTVLCDNFSLISHAKYVLDKIEEVSSVNEVLDLCPDEAIR